MTSNCLEVLVLVLVLVVVALATPRSPHTLPLVKSITSGNGVTAPETGPGQKQSKLIAKTDKKMGEITLKSRASTVKYPVFFKNGMPDLRRNWCQTGGQINGQYGEETVGKASGQAG